MNFIYPKEITSKSFIILIAIMFLASIKATSQTNTLDNTRINILINVTKEVMMDLNIRIRPNVYLDSPMKILVDTSLTTLKARFDASRGYFPFGGDTALRFYANPTISLSKKLDSIMLEQKYTKNDIQILANSILVHELTHYLQSTHVNIQLYKNGFKSDAEYFYLPNEYEAWLAQCYNFIKEQSPNTLNAILNCSKSSKEKENMLFDYFFSTKKKIYLNYPSMVKLIISR